MNNPFSINFGKVPNQYISRDVVINEIIEEITSDYYQNQCFMLTGTRGSGKTVTMTALEKRVSELDDWIIVRLNPTRNMIESLVAKLYDSRDYLTKFLKANVNLSKFGIGTTIESQPPVADIESALEIILNQIKKKKKRLLVTIDEVSNTSHMREFASAFQILVREELPIFLVMAGLFENIRNLKDQDNLTFLYRTPQYDMEPLNLVRVRDQYSKIFKISRDKAMEMALITKGYPFAYQALGKYLWDDPKHELNDDVLYAFDDCLRHYVYEKIWSSLSSKDRFYMAAIVKQPMIKTSDLLLSTNTKKNEFSQYRSRLKDKGLINVQTRGVIKCTLPRFDVFVMNMSYEEM